MKLHGIELKPGMVLETSENTLWIVIPYQENDVAFVSYSDRNSWTTILDDKIIAIYAHPNAGSIKGKCIWKQDNLKPGDYISYYNARYNCTHIGLIKEVHENYLILSCVTDAYDKLKTDPDIIWCTSDCELATMNQIASFQKKVKQQGGYIKDNRIYLFQPYDRVLAKATENSVWTPTLISYVKNGSVYTIDCEEAVYAAIPFDPKLVGEL